MSFVLNGYDFEGREVLDVLDDAGEYDLREWAGPKVEDADFQDRLAAAAESELEVNGDPEAGYDETSAIVSAVRSLRDAEGRSSVPDVPVDRSPRARPSSLAERRLAS